MIKWPGRGEEAQAGAGREGRPQRPEAALGDHWRSDAPEGRASPSRLVDGQETETTESENVDKVGLLKSYVWHDWHTCITSLKKFFNTKFLI